MQQEEKRRHRNSMILSVTIHSAILLLFFFLLAWSPPDPPIPEYGIELNFGLDAVGSGDQETTEVSEVESEQESPNESEVENEVEEIEEVVETPEDSPTEEATEESTDVDYEDVASPDKIEPKESEEVVKEESKEEVVEVKEPKEDPKPIVTYPSGGGKEGEGNDNEKGNKGDPKGGDGVSYEGSPGSGSGGLSVSGWKWEKEPKPADDSDAAGLIKFSIGIGQFGEIVELKVIETTVPPSVVELYKKEIYKTKFTRTSGSVSKISRGTATFRIQRR